MGKLKEINKFDASFFGVPQEKADVMDPQGRILFEKIFEAIIDAGTNFSVSCCGFQWKQFL